MNGLTTINEILNPCSAEFDKHVYGWRCLNFSVYGCRLIYINIGRLTIDIYRGAKKPFTAMSGGAPGIDRYWQLFWWFGQVMWIAHKSGETK